MKITQQFAKPVIESVILELTVAEVNVLIDALNSVDSWDLWESQRLIFQSVRLNLGNALNPQQPQQVWHQAAADAIAKDKRILAIKEVRAGTGWGLKQAKDYVDEHWPRTPQDARY